MLIGHGILNCPAAHVWGSNDDVELGQAQALSMLCRTEDSWVYVHQGGYEIPGPRSQDELTYSVHAM